MLAKILPALFLWPFIAVMAGCSDSQDDPEPEERLGFEILEVQSFNSIRAWISPQITLEEFQALELPEGWIKNQVRESGEDVTRPDSVRFVKSPDSVEDGDILVENLFGFDWFHAATVIEPRRQLDDEGLLIGTTVRKFHELIFNAGSTLVLLVSPEGLIYFRIGRDANRVSDQPSIPNLWQLLDYTTTDRLVIELFGETTVIRADNEDSFQGPIVIDGLATGA